MRERLFNRTFDVSDFGARGDGITDDTEAIRSALDEASQTDDAEVYLPPGTYRVSAPRDMDCLGETGACDGSLHISSSNVALVGAGRDQTTITNGDQTAPIIRVASRAGDTSMVITNVHIAGLRLVNSADPNSSMSGRGAIYFDTRPGPDRKDHDR